MNSYKINKDAIEVWGNNGRDQLDKNKLFHNSKILASEFKEILNDIRKLKSNKFNSYICSFKYIQIPAKGWRLNFGKLPKSINDVKQRGVFTFSEKEKIFTKLFYKLDNQDVKWLEDSVVMILDAKTVHDISDHVYKEFLRKIMTLGSKRNKNIPELRIKKISQSITIDSFSDIRVIKVLPIKEVIDFLKTEKILNNDNFDKDLMIAYLKYEEVEKANKFGFNIFYSSSKMVNYQISETNLDNIIKPIFINGTARKEIVGIIDSANTLGKPFSDFILSNDDYREYKHFKENTHGSQVASLIIANDELNPSQADGFGNFNVRHFEILEPFNSKSNREKVASVRYPYLMKKIPEIVKSNPDIRVWNLSFGAVKKPYSRMISEQGKLIDKLSKDLDIIFVISSGNEREKHKMYSLNSPGDSLNSLTVGSSRKLKDDVSFSKYSSIGPILYFEKPEVSHFGGPRNIDGSEMVAFGPNFSSRISGTSFSTPRVCRMIAAFISDGLSPSEAKAKVISMATKETPTKRASAFGHIRNIIPKIEMNFEPTIYDKNPRYIPIEFSEDIENIKVSLVNQVEPMSMFGEDYSIQNFEASVIVYDSSVKNPENDYVGLQSKNINRITNKYSQESYLRFDGGKYFNSSIYVTNLNEIYEKKSLLLEKGCLSKNIKTAIRIKKLDLFETQEEQPSKVSAYISIFGENININDFELKNSSIIEAVSESEAIAEA